MISATDMKAIDRERQAKAFEYMMESFIKQWAPGDRRDAAQFQAELHSLVRQIYRDAQEPLLDHITKLASAMPMFPQTIIPDGPANVR